MDVKKMDVYQPAPLDQKEMLRRNYLIGYPVNFSFESGTSGWNLNTTNKVVYTEPQNSSHGNKFLQVNNSESDIGKGFSQNIKRGLLKSHDYAFSLKAKSNGTNANFRMKIVGKKNNNWIELCSDQYKADNLYSEYRCVANVKEDGYSEVELRVEILQAGTNYSFDEIYFIGPNMAKFNPNKKFFMMYQGDQDMSSALQVIRTGVYPFTWFDSSENIDTGWGMSANISEVIPKIWEYFAKTKKDSQTWMMTDSGAGYLNVSDLPNEYVDEWIKESAILQRQFQFRSGWDLEGPDLEASLNNNNILKTFKIIAPEGIFYNGEESTIRSGLAIVPMKGLSYAGDRVDKKVDELVNLVKNNNFLVLRNIYVSDKHLKEIVDKTKEKGLSFEIVDPTTFFYLFKIKNNLDIKHRLSVVENNVPNQMEKDKTYQVSVKIRNDGFAIWRKKDGNYCDDSGKEGSGCYAIGWGFQKESDFSPGGMGNSPHFPYSARVNFDKEIIMPGEEVVLNFEIKAPSEDGNWLFQVDGVKELWEFFETNGNVPWLKRIKVGYKQEDLCVPLTSASMADLITWYGVYRNGGSDEKANFNCKDGVDIADLIYWYGKYRN